MQKMTISLVSITDKNNKIQDNDSLRSLVGQRAALVLDKNNKADARAVKAVFNHYVGFVRMADVHNGIYNLVIRQKYSPIATVIAMGEYRGCLVAEVEYAGDAPEIIDLQKIHSQWKYDGPVFPEIPEIEKLNNATRYLLALLVNQNADYENINERFETFVSLMKYGFSKEFNDKRREIDQLLKKYPDEKVRELRDKLKEISKTIHSEKSRYQAFSHIIKKMKKYIDRNFKEQALKYSISEITKQIKAFPSRITKDTDSTKVYPLRVYYEFMSENVLYNLFFVIATRTGYFLTLFNKNTVTFRAEFINWFIPRSKVALRIIRTAIEVFAFTRFFHDYFTITFWARHYFNYYWFFFFNVLAFWIVRTCCESTITAFSND